MLRSLDIQGFALLHQVQFEPDEGLNLVTGETGAGKSMLVDALGFVLGVKAGLDVVAAGETACRVVAQFEPTGERLKAVAGMLEEKGLPPMADDGLWLKREMSAQGRSRAWVNGESAPAAALAALGDLLVDLHGQHEHQSLLKPGEQAALLDEACGAGDDLAAVAEAWTAWRGARERLEALEMDAGERERRRELLAFQATELKAAGLKVGEAVELERERGLLASAEKRAVAAALADGHLSGGDEHAGACAAAVQGARALKDLAALDPLAAPWLKRLDAMCVELADIGAEVSRYRQGVEFDPARLEKVEERLEHLARLKRKYGPDEAAMLAYLDSVEAQLNDLVDVSAAREALRREIAQAESAWGAAAARLSARRRQGSLELARAVNARLKRLGMDKAAFGVKLEPREPSAHGAEAAQFNLAANPGEPARPLARVASGGELSRVMLALKGGLAAGAGVPVLVFDEVDAGVSGKVAGAVGQELARLARGRQALVVTHLPQIACLPGAHFHVGKAVRDGRTASTLRRLDREGREREVAQMIAGAQSGPSALEHARTLLDEAAAAAGA